jgi:hypothetical protein
VGKEEIFIPPRTPPKIKKAISYFLLNLHQTKNPQTIEQFFHLNGNSVRFRENYENFMKEIANQNNNLTVKDGMIWYHST